MYHTFTILLLNLFFIVAGFTDLKSNALPIRFLPLIYLLTFVDLCLHLTPFGIALHFFSAAAIFVMFYILAKFFGCGGGDALLLPILAFEHGLLYSILVIGVGSILSMIIGVLRQFKNEKKFSPQMEFPLIPGIAVVYVVSTVLLN